MTKAIIFDLDNTLINTDNVKEYRDKRDWDNAELYIPSCYYKPELLQIIKKYKKKGVKIGVVSSSRTQYCKKVLDYMKLDVDAIIGYQDTHNHKPNIEPLFQAIQILGKPGIAIGVGDSQEDHDCYVAAGLPCVNVTWYANNHVRLNEGGCSISTVDDFDRFLYAMLMNDEVDDRYKSIYKKTFADISYKSVVRKYSNQELKVTKRDGIYFVLPYDKNNAFGTKDDVLHYKNCNANMVEWFSRVIENQIMNIAVNPNSSNYVLCQIPSHSSGKWSLATDEVIRGICQKHGFINGKHILRRHIDIDKLSSNYSSRTVKKHLDSIVVDAYVPIEGQHVILFDDVTTSGTSMRACESLLTRAGAKSVCKVALAYTACSVDTYDEEYEIVSRSKSIQDGNTSSSRIESPNPDSNSKENNMQQTKACATNLELKVGCRLIDTNGKTMWLEDIMEEGQSFVVGKHGVFTTISTDDLFRRYKVLNRDGSTVDIHSESTSTITAQLGTSESLEVEPNVVTDENAIYEMELRAANNKIQEASSIQVECIKRIANANETIRKLPFYSVREKKLQKSIIEQTEKELLSAKKNLEQGKMLLRRAEGKKPIATSEKHKPVKADNHCKKSAGAKWTKEEDEQLIIESIADVPISQMAINHQRTTGAIRSRLKKLKLV